MQQHKAGPEVFKRLQTLIDKYHPNLLIIQDEIAIVFKEKASTPGGTVVLGKTKKASPLLVLMTDFPWKYIIEIGEDEWMNLSTRQRDALLDHHLCAMAVEEDPQSGEIKCGVRPPTVVGYEEELERWGFWRPHAPQASPTLVEQMFGDCSGKDD